MAAELVVTEAAVKQHLLRLYQKFRVPEGINRRTRLANEVIAMGLVPGAGGTASIPRRVGRHRAAHLALAGRPIDAATALDWGLVDRIDDDGFPRPTPEPEPTR